MDGKAGEAGLPGPQGDGRGFSHVLEGLGSSKECAQYVERTLHPFMLGMVLEAVRAMPADPATFCFRWLLTRLEAPISLTAPLLKWLANREKDGYPSDADSCSDATSNRGEESEEPAATPRPAPSLPQPTASGSFSGASSPHSILRKPNEPLHKGRRTASFSQEVVSHEIPRVEESQAGHSPRHAGFRRRRSSVRVLDFPAAEMDRILSGVPYIRDLEEADRAVVAEQCVVRHFDAHSEIVRYGDMSAELFVVVSGNCRVSVPEFKQVLQPGDCFNEGVLVKGEVAVDAMLSAAPNTDVTVLSVSVKDIQARGVWKKLLRKHKKSADSHYIAHSDLRGGTCSDGPARPLGFQVSQDESVNEEPPFVPDEASYVKSEQEIELIKLAVGRNQLTELLQLSEEQIQELASSMYLREYPANSVVINKGDRGEHFFVVREGLLELINNPDPRDPNRNAPGTVPLHFHAGSSFGELALLYSSLRKATVVSVRPTSLWVLELSGWRNVLAKMPASRLVDYQAMLDAVPELCAAIPQQEKRHAIADCLEEVYYRSGETVVVEGTNSYTLHIILDGSCGTTVECQRARSLGKGDYFGEGSLLRGAAYPETVFVTSAHATILQLDRETCRHLRLGISFEEMGTSTSGRVVQARRHSLAHMATMEASSFSLHRLDFKRIEIPISRLQPVGILGAGAFAVVSLMQDPATDKLYALKAMSKQAIIEQGLKGTVVAERNALAELDSPFVVKLVTTYRDDDRIYLLLEPCLGGELFTLYSAHDWYGEEDKASFYTVCVALGIDHIHSKKIIHRDIKLENILVDSKGYARVTDLGIAKVVIGKTYTVCGTSDYLAPETLKQAGHNRAVDWWALGILTYAMMAGKMPFDAEDVLQIYKNIVKGFRKDHFPESFSADLVDFVKGLCKKKPQERTPMMPGGVRNLATHPWLDNGETPSKWQQIESLTFPAPWTPPELTVEERRATLKQTHDGPPLDEYIGDGTNWDEPF